ncbi:MAG: PA2169 family four-helix-bundle protein [Pseudomonadota bacterium]
MPDINDRKDALKSLYTRLIDSRDGYQQLLENAEQSAHKAIFVDMIERRTANSAEIKSYLVNLGEPVDDDGSLLAAAHRLWVDAKAWISDGDDAIMQELIRGEESLLKAYDEAIEPATVTSPEYQFLNTQHESLRALIDSWKADLEQAA